MGTQNPIATTIKMLIGNVGMRGVSHNLEKNANAAKNRANRNFGMKTPCMKYAKQMEHNILIFRSHGMGQIH